MGNLIKDFWTYTYKDKQYFGINEVVLGEDLAQNRSNKKYETHIEKVLAYTAAAGRKALSHMSLQSFCTFLNDRTIRTEEEDRYYPFTLEFESADTNKYQEVVWETIRYIKYLVYELGINENDIVPMINNSRSIYVFVNPKAFDLKPSKSLHNVYRGMYEAINDAIGLKYVDQSIFASYKLIKAPNCYYKGGYFIRVSLNELENLSRDPGLKGKLTAVKRLMNVNIPGELSDGLKRLYINALEDDTYKKKIVKQITYIKKESCKCVEYMENCYIEKGSQNYALVSIAICKKNQGYTEDQVIDILKPIAASWNHDESERDLEAKVRSVFRKDYRFSCTYVKKALIDVNIEECCSACIYGCNKKDNTHIDINADIIADLWAHGASTRHFITYLRLLEQDLLDRWFNPSEHGFKDRTIRELCGFTKNLSREKNNKKELIYINRGVTGNVYRLPKAFIETTSNILGDYLKHFLMLIIKGYKANNKYILMRVSKKKIMADLGYKDITGVNKLLSKLRKLDLLIQNKSIMCLYYEPYKVVNIEEYKESNNKNNDHDEAFETVEAYKKVVNYFQIIMDNLPLGRTNKLLNQRGSPG